MHTLSRSQPDVAVGGNASVASSTFIYQPASGFVGRAGESFTRPRARPCLSVPDAMTLLAMYLSAVIHDFDHRGVSNAFLIQDEDPLAVRSRVFVCLLFVV